MTPAGAPPVAAGPAAAAAAGPAATWRQPRRHPPTGRLAGACLSEATAVPMLADCAAANYNTGSLGRGEAIRGRGFHAYLLSNTPKTKRSKPTNKIAMKKGGEELCEFVCVRM